EQAERIATRRAKEAQHGLSPFVLQRRPPGSPDSIPAALRLRLDVDLLAGWAADALVVTGQVLYQEHKRRLDKVSPSLPLSFDDHDVDVLYVLEDFAGTDGSPGSLTLTRERFLALLHACAPGELAQLSGGPSLPVQAEPQLSVLAVSLLPGTGTLKVVHRLDEPVMAYLPGRRHVWALLGNRLVPLEAMLPDELCDVYGDGTTMIPRERVMPFLRRVLPLCEKRHLVESSVRETDFQFEEGQPTFVLELDGTPELMMVRLWADYGGGRVRATEGDAQVEMTYPLPGKPTTFVTRNATAETAAVDWLTAHDAVQPEGKGFQAIRGVDQVLSVLSEVVPAAQARGWRVHTLGAMEHLADGADWVRPSVSIAAAGDAGWFDASVVYADAAGAPIAPSNVDAAVDAGRSSLELDGRLLLANRALLRALRMACLECMDTEEDVLHGRISEVHAGYFSSILAMHPGIAVTADAAWHAQVRRQTEKTDLEDVMLPPALGQVLRPYQRVGVNWLRYLERGGFCGILADEMGLGKTIQALAWLQLERLSPSARGLPSLVVCPTSLVYNWARESARFTPDLRVRLVTGSDRHHRWDALSEHDLIITSYALLRRDIGRYEDQQFAVAVLDEAQHIKNRSTQNAQAARQLKAVHRLVLTGTPMENAVSDLWSIMDYLMPGYLGAHALFRESFERPISVGGKAAEDAIQRLRCKIQPFMMRRLKSMVAADLPPRLTRVASCVMGPRQAALYRELVAESRGRLAALVTEKGFNASRMTVLKTLLRLRQLCCHPSLLRRAEDEDVPSAKLELFFELLDEAMDGGQRVLVFSQFVEMLRILRRELDARGLRYAYLDGATRNRQAEVDRFQNDVSCPIFLISLKAGGTGLNLTGASVVMHFDPWWNPAVEDQATDRAHRIGQTRSVYSIKLVTAGDGGRAGAGVAGA
ncbi:MAG: DEAD/DEAH box helicase, partial [Verrucomicrobia bacterium]|nr:DEAD/DEAH box helicase [Verrucomicrobiota bacterium]